MQGLTTMGKGFKRHLKRFFLLLGLLLLTAGLVSLAVARQAPPEADPGRADIVTIDGLKAFGPLERPPVVFFHDKHTEALAKEQKDCLTCHPQGEKFLSLKYQRTADTDKQSVMDVYHSGCIACHTEYRQQDKPSGPVTCGQCHVEDKAVENIRAGIGLDKSLHYRHAKANENKCERCHHAYNPETKQLYYDKGKEGACLYCHKDQPEENRMAYRQAAHLDCIGCHRDLAALKKDAGPMECAGCHDPEAQALITRVADIPRLERNQPDVTLVKAHREDEKVDAQKPRMALVPFDHLKHEGAAQNCRTCHHAELTSCASCHPIQGHADGKMVKLAQAMHQQDAEMSCVGCHTQRQLRSECAGCHASMPAEKVWAGEAACKVCHMPQEMPVARPGYEMLASEMAAPLIDARRKAPAPVAVDDIPETVVIGHLADAYEAVKMPHRQIVRKLSDLVSNDGLAAAFHTQPTTLCQGCHHNSPASLKPPQCGACHGRTSDALNLTRPGLMAAYHEQCMLCHEQMGIEKPANRDCTACHAKRASSQRNN